MEIVGQQVAFNMSTAVGEFSVMVNPVMKPNSLEAIDRLMVNATSATALSGDWLCRVYGLVYAAGVLGGMTNGVYIGLDRPKVAFEMHAKQPDREIQVWKPGIDKKTGKERKNAASSETVAHIEDVFWAAFQDLFTDHDRAHVIHITLLKVECERRERRIAKLKDIIYEMEKVSLHGEYGQHGIMG